MSRRALALALSLALIGCVGPVKPGGNGPVEDRELSQRSIGERILPVGGRQEVPAEAVKKVIKGQVRMTRQLLNAYRLLGASEGPVVGAVVDVLQFGQQARVRGPMVRTDAEGRFVTGADTLEAPLFVRAVAEVGGERVSVYAPVPFDGRTEVTVNVDLASTMLVQYILERGKDSRMAQVLLDPATLEKLQSGLTGRLTDENAPDLRKPTAVFEFLEGLRRTDRTIQSTLEQAEKQAPPPAAEPLPSPTTIVPEAPVPGPTTFDPPIFDGEGPAVTGEPKPASYLAQAFTKLQRPGHMAVVRFQPLDEVFMAAVDHERKTVFGFFRDAGSPTHFSASALKVAAPLSVALARDGKMVVLGTDKLVRASVGLGPALSEVSELASGAAIAGATAVAVAPDGAILVGYDDGRVLKRGADGQPVAAFAARVADAVAGLAVAADGTIYVAQRGGAIAQLGAAGAVTNAAYASVPAPTSLSVDPLGALYAGSADKQVHRVKPGQPADKLLDTPDAVTGVGSLGGYLFLVEANGNLDCLTTADR